VKASWRVRLVSLGSVAAYAVWQASEYGWESAVFWLVLMSLGLALLFLFLRLLARQEGKSHPVWRRSALWGIFVVVSLGPPALLWIFIVGDPLGFIGLLGGSAVLAGICYAVMRLKAS
jgi:hypothetical protein